MERQAKRIYARIFLRPVIRLKATNNKTLETKKVYIISVLIPDLLYQNINGRS